MFSMLTLIRSSTLELKHVAELQGKNCSRSTTEFLAKAPPLILYRDAFLGISKHQARLAGSEMLKFSLTILA